MVRSHRVVDIGATDLSATDLPEPPRKLDVALPAITDSARSKTFLAVKSGNNESPRTKRRAGRSFRAIETWVFDLDNTLYPHHLNNLWHQVDARIRDYHHHAVALPSRRS